MLPIAFALSAPRRLLVATALVGFSFAPAARADLLVLQAGYSGHGPGLVSRIDPATGVAGAPLLPMNESCQALSAAPDGSVYVTANVAGYGVVYRYRATGELLGKVADIPGTQFEAIAASASGRVYLLAVSYREDGTATRAIVRASVRSAAPPTPFVAPGTGRMFAPVALALGPDGYLYVADLAAGVLRFDAKTGAFVDVFVPPGRGGLRDATALAFGNDRRLYVGTTEAHAVLRFDSTTGAFVDAFVTTAAGESPGVRAIAFGADGDLYALAASEHAVRRYDGRNGASLGVVAGSPAWQRPSAIACVAPRSVAEFRSE